MSFESFATTCLTCVSTLQCLDLPEPAEDAVSPNVVSFSSAISSCAKARHWDQALHIMSEMRHFAVFVSVCTCTVNGILAQYNNTDFIWHKFIHGFDLGSPFLLESCNFDIKGVPIHLLFGTGLMLWSQTLWHIPLCLLLVIKLSNGSGLWKTGWIWRMQAQSDHIHKLIVVLRYDLLICIYGMI